MLAFARPTAPAVYESTQQLAKQQSIAEVPSIRCVLSLQRLPPAVCVLACRKMAVGPEISISEGRLLISGTPLLSAVPDNVVLTPHQGLGPVSGAFLGATALESSSRHLFTLGTFEDLRFMCCFRFKIWWMTQRMGSCGREVPQETQFMLLESKATDEVALDGTAQCRVYTVLLPLLEGSFRASLQGSELNELQLCLESGDPKVQSCEGLHALFMASGTDPFQVVSDAVRAIEAHSRSFSHREKKKMPGILDVFGWCTWNAFYIDVSADKVNQGLNSLSQGCTPARFLIIDDGWQSIQSENRDNATVTDGMQYASRLTSIKANHKFHGDADLKASRSPVSGLQRTVQEAKEKYNVRYIYVWHALTGYWGGVQPNSTEMQEYEPALKYPVHSPGVLANQPDMAVDSLTTNGLGLVKPEKLFTFYNDLHSYLASSGVDGVKVDAQSIIETLGAGAGGRVSLVRQYTEALEASVTRNFPDNGCIACMSHSLDGVYSTKRTPVVRASDDFYPEDPASHTIHIASVAYNSLFLGEFMQPDWDMFQTLHPAAAYHGAARAVGGCPIYVSDKPGHHDFDLLRKLVLPNGSVLRARLPGRPTWDSLFVDPARDDTSLLKIWNMNKCTGVLGVFNCQGAGWCKVGRRNTIHDTSPKTLTGSLHGCDVHLLESAAGKDWNGDCMFYSHQAGKVLLLPRGAAFPVTLKVLEFEVYTVTPLKELASGARFAPIGLLDMFNSGGAVEELSYQVDESLVRMVIQGCGRFGVYTSQRPRAVFTDSAVPDDVLYDEVDGLLSFTVPTMKEAGQLWDVTLHL